MTLTGSLFEMLGNQKPNIADESFFALFAGPHISLGSRVGDFEPQRQKLPKKGSERDPG